MNGHPHPTCDDDLLRAWLRTAEGSDDDRRAAEHLDTCPRCRARLEHLAAEENLWQDARELLVEEDPENGGDETRDHWLRPWRPKAWSESMARKVLSPPSHPEMLGRIGRYEVERIIGSGGMGVVFKAFDTELNRPVAVKVLAPYLADNGAARKRFAREARAAAAVVHEHVVAIHNVESDGEAPFLVMQYVAGESLQQRLDREGPLDLCEILRVGTQTAAGLAAAHSQGLVHRDVKPSNVLMERGIERSLLTDFGLARANDDASLTRTGHHPGTPQYMSPEQARGDAVDSRSDLFSFGSLMYAMCTARPPFRAETSYGILRRITDTEPRPIREINPNIPEWLARLVGRLMAKSPEGRFTQAAEVADLLKRCLAHVQQPTAVELPEECCGPELRARWPDFARRPAAWIGAVGVVVSLSAIGFLVRGAIWPSRAGPDGSSRPQARQAASPSPATENSAGASLSGSPEEAWEFSARDLERFGQDLAPLEKRAGQLWDAEPAARPE